MIPYPSAATFSLEDFLCGFHRILRSQYGMFSSHSFFSDLFFAPSITIPLALLSWLASPTWIETHGVIVDVLDMSDSHMLYFNVSFVEFKQLPGMASFSPLQMDKVFT